MRRRGRKCRINASILNGNHTVEILAAPEPPLRALARAVLHRERAQLPDLSRVTILLASGAHTEELRQELAQEAARLGTPALLLPQLTVLGPWLHALDAAQIAPRQRLFALADVLDPLLRQRLSFLDANERLTVSHELLVLFDGWIAPGHWPRFLEHIERAYGRGSSAPDMSPLTDEARLVHAAWRLWRRFLQRRPEYRDPDVAAHRLPESADPYYLGPIRNPPHVFVRWFEERLKRGTGYLVLPPLASYTAPWAVFCGEHPHRVEVHEPTAATRLLASLLGAPVQTAPMGGVSPLAGLSWFEGANLEEEAWFITQRILATSGSTGIACPDRKLARRVRALLERQGIAIMDAAGWSLATTSASGLLHLFWEACAAPRGTLAWTQLARCPFARPSPEQGPAPATWEERVWAASEGVRHALTDAQPLAVFHDALLIALRQAGMDQLLAEDAAGNTLLQVLETLQADIRDHRGTFLPAEYFTWLRGELDGARFVPPHAGCSVRLLDLAAAGDYRFDLLLITGADAAHLGETTRQRIFFKDSVRQELGLPAAREDQAQERQLFQLLLEGAPEVVVSWHRRDQKQALRPTPWLDLIRIGHRRHFGTDLTLAASRPKSALTRSPSSGTKAVHMTVPAALRPERLSAAAYQRWIDCPFQYFAAEVLRLRARPETTEDRAALEYGLRVHRILEAFWSPVTGLPGPFPHPLAAHRRREAEILLMTIGHRVFADQGARGALEQAQWETCIPAYVAWELEHGPERTVLGTEVPLDRLLCGSSPTVLNGRVDRLDRSCDGLSILDYKTGTLPQGAALEGGEVGALPFYGLLPPEPVAELCLVRVHEDFAVRCLTGDVLQHTLEQTEHRLRTLDAMLTTDLPFAAHGDRLTCGRCAYEGLCRRSYCDTPDHTRPEDALAHAQPGT